MATDKDILKLARERYALEKRVNANLRTRQEGELRFVAGHQWPEAIKNQRENDPYGARPCLVINHARTHCNRVINDIRQNRPQIKTLPVDNDADPKTAEIFDGLIRHIQVAGDADLAYDTATQFMVHCGEGYFEIVTRVIDEETQEQELDLEPVMNPHAVHMDPHHENPTGADAKWCFIDDIRKREDLEKEFPGVELSDWSGAESKLDLRDWYIDEDNINAARYYYLEDGVWHVCKLVGDAILERSTFPGKYLPVIRVAGEELVSDGEKDSKGLVRDLMDPCRAYNYWASVNTERIALSPKAPYVGPDAAFENFEELWNLANTANIPRLPYNHVDSEGNAIPPPTRQQPVSQDTAIIQAMMHSHDDIKSVTGQHDPSLGVKSNETSGVAIANRQRESNTITFHFTDNLSRAIRQAGRVLIGLIPLLYNTEKVIRILGEDEMTTDFAQIAPTEQAYSETQDAAGQISRIYDLGVGEYDVTVRAGPSYSTRRQESVAEMAGLMQHNPQAFALIGHKLIKNMDWPGADEAAEILEAMLPPEAKAIIDAKKEGGDEVRAQVEMAQKAVMDQVEPVIVELQQQIGQAGEEAQKATIENQSLKLENQALKAALQNKAAEIQVKAREVDVKAREMAVKEAEVGIKREEIQTTAEKDIVIAAINAKDEEPKKDDDLSSTVAAQASLAAAKQMEELAESLKEQSDALARTATVTSSEVIQLQQHISEREARQKKVQQAVLGFVKSEQSDADLQKTIQDIEKP